MSYDPNNFRRDMHQAIRGIAETHWAECTTLISLVNKIAKPFMDTIELKDHERPFLTHSPLDKEKPGFGVTIDTSFSVSTVRGKFEIFLDQRGVFQITSKAGEKEVKGEARQEHQVINHLMIWLGQMGLEANRNLYEQLLQVNKSPRSASPAPN